MPKRVAAVVIYKVPGGVTVIVQTMTAVVTVIFQTMTTVITVIVQTMTAVVTVIRQTRVPTTLSCHQSHGTVVSDVAVVVPTLHLHPAVQNAGSVPVLRKAVQRLLLLLLMLGCQRLRTEHNIGRGGNSSCQLLLLVLLRLLHR
jgi:hypothetical protein